MSKSFESNQTKTKELKNLLEQFLLSSGVENVHKPFRCLNPVHEDKNPSMSFNKRTNTVKCFSRCDQSFDIFSLVGIIYNLDSFKEQKEFLLNKGYSSNNSTDTFLPITKTPSETKPNVNSKINNSSKNQKDYTRFYEISNRNLNKQNYLPSRGISTRTANNFNIGYCESFNQNDQTIQVIVFPITKSCFEVRNIDPKNSLRYAKRGRSYIWNLDNVINQNIILDTNNQKRKLFITESIIDALSLCELGLNKNSYVISLTSCANGNLLIDEIKNNLDFYKRRFKFCLFLDNDQKGIDTTKILKEFLVNNNFNHENYSNKYLEPNNLKDVNDYLKYIKEK